MSPMSTDEVAKRIGIHRVTLERWISSGRLLGPKTVTVGGRTFRLWTDSDIDKATLFKKKFYRKGRGRKKKQ